MQEGSEYLEGTWDALHVDWARQDGEVSGSAVRNIRARMALVTHCQNPLGVHFR